MELLGNKSEPPLEWRQPVLLCWSWSEICGRGGGERRGFPLNIPRELWDKE